MSNYGYSKIPNKQDSHGSPNHSRGWFSTLTLGWMNDTFKTGYVRPLEQSDLLPLDEENRTKLLTEQLQQMWDTEKKRLSAEGGKAPGRLWKIVLKVISVKVVCAILSLGLFGTICETVQPLLLGIIVSGLKSHNTDKTLMYVCAGLMALLALGKGLSMHHKNLQMFRLGARFSAALRGVVYCKLQRLSLKTIQDISEGQVIDLVSNDVQTMEETPMWFFECVRAFASIGIIFVLLGYFFGWMALVGAIFLFALIPFLFLIASFTGKLRGHIALASDQRLSAINEMLLGIRAIKTHAWEGNYWANVKELRRCEISIYRKRTFAVSIIEVIIYASVVIATFLTVLSLSLTGHRIGPDNGFMLLAFMFVINRRITLSLGRGLQTLSEAFVSLKRIENFLNLEELPFNGHFKDNRSWKNHGTHQMIGVKRVNHPANHSKEGGLQKPFEDDDKVTVSSRHLSVSALSCKVSTETNGKDILNEISFSAHINSLTILTGPVGSGKSTLLSSIAGEVKLSSGTVSCLGTVAYVPQLPWIFSGTVRENILFGEHYNQDWFSTVIDACSLGEDIKSFPDGDQTMVGERGVVLSGGQKARVSLARAVYGRSDVYLLDDPLSAVDIAVGEQIFEKCIFGLLSDRICVMTSNQTKNMEKADLVVLLDGGRILAKGTFSELAQNEVLTSLSLKGDWASMIPNTELLHNFESQRRIRKERQNRPCIGIAIPKEDRAVGNVSFRLYWGYFRAAAGPVTILSLIGVFFISHAIVVSPDLWLSYLSKQTTEMQRDSVNLGIYACVTGASLLTTIIRVLILMFACLQSSQNLHNDMVTSILHAPVSFFDTNPAGRVLNRFSKDTGSMDRLLPKKILMAVQYFLFAFAAALVPAIFNLWLMFVLVPLVSLLVLFSRYFLKTSRDLKRLQATCGSPVFSHFSDTLNGLDTIRTRGRAISFIDEFYRRQDVNNEAFLLKIAGDGWFGIRIEVLCTIFIATVALSVVSFSLDPVLAGISLAYVNETVAKTQYAVRHFSEVENLMTSVERVITYCQIEPEPGYKNETAPPRHWPSNGHLTFSEVFLTYYPGGPQVLSNLNFSIPAKAKIGVVGRTGAGKSSFVAAILRMPDADGDISIDGVKLKDINLQESRRCISVLNQEPLLFSGTLKRNLDPLGQHDDTELWAVLDEVQLKSFVENLDEKLDYKLAERGNNLSVGERQLICLARTLLQHNKIVILDEPTAHVDPVTEKTLWNTVHEKLKDCTVITIAHRLSTIRDCDTIMVFRDGQIVEFGRFDILSGREGGVLTSLVETSDLH